MSDSVALREAIQAQWLPRNEPDGKAKQYVDKFTGRHRRGRNIWADVDGNHGTYTVSIRLEGSHLTAACSCYIGKHGGCHHVTALGYTFVKNPDSFTLIPTIVLEQVQDLDSLCTYLNGVTLDELVEQLKKKGISQKAFAESIGMSTQHLSAVKRAEKSNRTYHELGATKLACVWVLTHLTGKE